MTSSDLSPVQRRLVPSIADFLFVGWLVTRLHQTLFLDGDTAWHLWAGNWLLSHGPGPIADPLSFTRAGAPWASAQWMGEALLALAYRHAGYLGVGALCTLVFATTFAWLYRILVRETGHPPAALVVAVLAAQVELTSFLARPSVLSPLLFLAALELVRRPGPRPWELLGLPLVTVLWANVHPSAFLGPALAGAAWIGRPTDRGRSALLVALSLLALGATPSGFAWLGDLIPSRGNLGFFLRIDEWRAPEFREPRFWGELLFLVLALAARRGAGRLSLGEAGWGLGWLGAALVSSRLAPYAALAWAPFLARDLARPVAEGTARLGRALGRAWSTAREVTAPFERGLRPGLWPVLLGGLFLALAGRLAPLYPGVAHGFPSDRFPERALAAAERLGLGPRVFNGYRWGGYLSWAAPGRYRVFIDGRAGFFGDAVLADYLTVMELRPGWREVLARYRPDWILVPPDTPVASAAPLAGDWTVAYGDSTAVVLARRRS